MTGLSGDGMFHRNSRNAVANVIDGTSNTIFVGERLPRILPRPGRVP